MAMLSAIQEAQKDNLRNFNDYMMKVLEVRQHMFSLIFTLFLTLLKLWLLSQERLLIARQYDG